MINPLVGKTITAIEVAADKHALRFVLTDGEMVVQADGDCCSHTWIEHLELPALGFPALVTAVDNLELSAKNVESEDGLLQFYGCKISTDRGEMVIDYRNESNGYYGGSLSWPGDYHYGGVFNQNVSKYEWQKVSAESETDAR
jgi:hypothetical protein